MTPVLELAALHKQRHILGLEGGEHAGYVRHLHVAHFELNLLGPDKDVVHVGGVLVLNLQHKWITFNRNRDRYQYFLQCTNYRYNVTRGEQKARGSNL